MTMNAKKYLLRLSLLCSAALLGQNVYADTLGVWAGGGIWKADPSGTFRYQGDNVDLNNDLHLKEDNQNYVYAIFEHPIPIIPNVKVSQTTLDYAGSGTMSKNFGGVTYSGNVSTKMVLDHSDITLYYRFLDNIVNFDLGITGKTFDGKVTVSDASTTSTTKVDGTIPMLYASVGFDVPGVDLFIGVEANMLAIDNSSITDVTTKISYTTSYFLGVEAGVRSLTVELDNQNSNYSNMEFTGAYANVFLHF